MSDALIYDLSIHSPFANSDYKAVMFRCHLGIPQKPNFRVLKPLFHKADYELIIAFLMTIDWASMRSNYPTFYAFSPVFYEVINYTIEKCPHREDKNTGIFQEIALCEENYECG